MTPIEIERIRSIKRQVEVTIDTMKSMALNDGQMQVLQAVTSHITDYCNAMLADAQ